MMAAETRIRVFLADDHPVVLAGMKALVVADPDLELVGEAADGAVALRSATALRPDVVVLDLSMPTLNGAELAQRLLADWPSCRILVLTVQEDGGYVRRLLEIGVAGYVLKRSATEELTRAIHAVAGGGVYLDPAIAALALSRPERAALTPEQAAVAELSAREVEVLRLTAFGYSNKVIANTLKIGVKSVDTYKARAMAKLDFKSRVDLVRFAVRSGWMINP